MIKFIYSDSLCCNVARGFTRIRKYDNGKRFKSHYTWNDDDCVFYNDDVDDDYYMEIPEPDYYEDFRGRYFLTVLIDGMEE